MRRRSSGAPLNDALYDRSGAVSPFEDDDYVRFLRSLGGDEALPEEDDDDPDFDDDLRKLLEDLSDEERNAFPSFHRDAIPPESFHPWDYPPQHPLGSHALPPMLTAELPTGDLMEEHMLDRNDDWSCNGADHELDHLSPAWCTRSRFSLNSTDIADLEGRLYPYVDDTTYDEFPEMQYPVEFPTEMEMRLSVDFDKPTTRRQKRLAARIPTQPLRRKPGPYLRHSRYEKPSSSFVDIFPSELFCVDEDEEWHPRADEMQVNTLRGVVKMQTDAWTPNMIICLNRIVAAHTQLLTQSFALCMGYPHLREVVEEMHVQLHSMYQMLQAQSHFDFGFDTMLKRDVASLSLQHKPKRHKRRPNQQQNKRRRRNKNTAVEAVIDLTEETLEDVSEPEGSLGSVLDVPMLQVLPHLWQALMVLSFSKKGHFFDTEGPLVDPCTKRMGYLPSLAYPKDIQSVMQNLDGLMTCGNMSAKRRSEIRSRSPKWVESESALLSYAVTLHKEDLLFIRKRYFPHRDVRTLERRLQSMIPDFDRHWKRIEALLVGTDKARVGTPGSSGQILRAQGHLLMFCDEFRTAQKAAGPANRVDRVNLGPSQQQSTALLKLLQEVIKNSTNQLTSQIFGQGPAIRLPEGSTQTTVMQNLMCLLLGQIGSHLAGSFDTLFTMMSVVAGMQLINGTDQGSPAQQDFQIIEIPQPDVTAQEEPTVNMGPPM